MASEHLPHVVIIGGGFGGLYAAKSLRNKPVRVTLIDKRNYHLFQPLLYQVATGGLSPGDIASPIRSVVCHAKNICVIKGEVTDLDPDRKQVILDEDRIDYDMLVIATGANHHYFGRDDWADDAPGLKTIEGALDIRRRIFSAFEAAEREQDPDVRKTMMRFLVVGGGPTGVELAGALGELAHHTLQHDFRHIRPEETEVILIEGADRILPMYPEDLSRKAVRSLEHLGVQVRTGTFVKEITGRIVTIQSGEDIEMIDAATVLWGAGVIGSPLGQVIAGKTGTLLHRDGRVIVKKDLSIPEYPDMFVIGDLAYLEDQNENPLPGVAPVAMQQGRYVADLILRRLKGKTSEPFIYLNKGSMAVIGRRAAVADLGFIRFGGTMAWLAWVFIHIAYLVEFDNKLIVLFRWAWNYFTKKRGARLITGEDVRKDQGQTEEVSTTSAPRSLSG